MEPLLCARHCARCFMPVLLFNPHNSPLDLFSSLFAGEETAAQSNDVTCKPAQGFSTPSCRRICGSCGRGISGPSFHPMVFINSSVGLPLICRLLPVSSSTRDTPFSFLSGGSCLSFLEKAEPLQGEFSNSSPPQPINLSIEMPQVLCEMRQCKINK